MVTVALGWKRLDWLPTETWRKNTLPKIEALGIPEKELKRSVYVIRLNGNFCIKYPSGQSPAVYIGEGNLSQRLTSHRSWTSELTDLVGDFSFQVCISLPRVRNNTEVYLDAEAALLDRFAARFGTAPLWNKQFEYRRTEYAYSQRALDEALCKRSGAKYKWAIAPMKASPFYKRVVPSQISPNTVFSKVR
jgi:hypothetical protein